MLGYTEFPLTKILAMGAALSSLPTSFSTIEQIVNQTFSSGIAGAEGLYRVVFNGVAGTLAEAKDGSGYLGTILDHGIKAQARLIKADIDPVKVTTVIPYNPTALFMAIALMGINQKLDHIQETQQEILSFLAQDKEAKLKGDLSMLSDTFNNYKYNWDNEKFISAKLNAVQSIRRDAKQNILFYRKQIEDNLRKKQLINITQDIQNKLGRIQNQFKYYRLAIYLYSFSSFVEVMLLGNFKSEYLNSVVNDLEKYSYQYRFFYTECYDQIERYAKKPIDSQLMNGVARFNQLAGDKVSKIPVVSKSQIDKFLIETGERLERFGSGKVENTMNQFKDNNNSGILIFIENINTIDRLYNQPIDLIFDREKNILVINDERVYPLHKMVLPWKPSGERHNRIKEESPMKFLHLSDLHLGKSIHEFSMLEDQEYILKVILGIADEERPQAVLISGDVFDRTVAPTEALRLFDDFLDGLVRRNMEVFVISGNHDSADRLAFGSRLMNRSGVHISPVYSGSIEPFTLSDEFGELDVFLLPFLKPVHVRRFFPEDEITSWTDAVRIVIGQMKIDEQKRNVLLAHQFVTGGATCESEEINVGGADNVDAEVFAPFDYVALGHLHGAQSIARPTVRYCGTPLKYSFSEASHKKSVSVIEIGNKDDVSIREIPLVPKRDMREIRGKYLEVTAREFYKSQNTEDYIRITLTDEEDQPDAMGKLRVIYRNLMRLDYDNVRTRTGHSVEGVTDASQFTPLQLFEMFFEEQNGRSISHVQQEYMNNLIEQVWEDAR